MFNIEDHGTSLFIIYFNEIFKNILINFLHFFLIYSDGFRYFLCSETLKALSDGK